MKTVNLKPSIERYHLVIINGVGSYGPSTRYTFIINRAGVVIKIIERYTATRVIKTIVNPNVIYVRVAMGETISSGWYREVSVKQDLKSLSVEIVLEKVNPQIRFGM